MSDLSAHRAASAASANNLIPGLRANAGAGSAGTPADSPSFSSVLKDKAKVANAEPKPAEKAERPREPEETAARPPERAEKEAPPAKAERAEKTAKPERTDRSTDEAATETTPANDATTITPIAAVMAQLTPAALVSAATQGEGQDAGHGALVRDLARGHGRAEKNEEGNHGLALAFGHGERSAGAATGAVDGSAAGTDDAGGSGANSGTNGSETPLPTLGDAGATDHASVTTEPAALAVGKDSSDTAEISTLADAKLQETDFSQLLTRARDGHAVVATGEGMAPSVRTETTLPMRAQVGHPNWSNEVGDKMTWMVTQQKQSADLVLNPPQLGRIEVSLTVNGDQASATFTSPNAAVRDMLENSLPRLREILAGSGLNLGQADVGAQSFAQQQQLAQDNQRADALARRGDHGAAVELPVQASGSMNLGRSGERSGVVDIFA